MKLPVLIVALVAALVGGGAAGSTWVPPGARLSTALTPHQQADYYVAQANKYFDGLDKTYSPFVLPNYSKLVARWEQPPWLLLTGFDRRNMIDTTRLALLTTPSTVPTRDCQAFAQQPFARCHVVIDYAQGACPIYEEFTFNNLGEVTFIEAWSDQPGLGPTADPSDYWAQGAGVQRLSTRVPGLGNPMGLIDLDSYWMRSAARQDAQVADFARRAKAFWPWWLESLATAEPDFFAVGCGWNTGTASR